MGHDLRGPLAPIRMAAQMLRMGSMDPVEQADTLKLLDRQVDLLLGPTSPTAAFAIGAKTEDPITMYLNDIYTIGANLAGLPAMSLPCGFADGLPVGLQLIGPHFSEARMLNAAHRYQMETDWHLRVPAAFG